MVSICRTITFLIIHSRIQTVFNLRRKEKFLLLDVSPEKIGGLLLSLDDQKKIRKEKLWENLERSPSSKRQPFIPNVSRVIAACDPELAFKVFIPLSIKREAGAEQLEKTELENLLAQAIGKVFNHYRREASTVLGADELNTILADSNISGFEVDGHKVMNPIGFKPKEINAVMEMTFAARQTFERVKAIRKKGDFFFTEKGQAQAAAAKRMGTKRTDFLLIGYRKSYFYPSGSLGTHYARRELKWSTDGLIAEICRNWSLSETAARNVYGYYAKEGVSAPLEKYFKKIFSRTVREFVGYVNKLKTSSKVYLVADVPLELAGRSTFLELPIESFAVKSGFVIDKKSFHVNSATFRQLAPFFEFYYDNSDSEINGWLKRRLHWLGSAV